ncbi:hypothetical protein COO91_03987 [Nostoc flagelliforme CCNUN1]|uniref:Uncharacterized protein n=1 Tax=Nostoc flagelliforme CCNUN1 TaxID=2038116 RepID=A0A2K8SRQ3_9NOSO|nr:hypothetical protein COO91_03987 [Nostoc flagelliforme CCNUN1]
MFSVGGKAELESGKGKSDAYAMTTNPAFIIVNYRAKRVEYKVLNI